MGGGASGAPAKYALRPISNNITSAFPVNNPDSLSVVFNMNSRSSTIFFLLHKCADGMTNASVYYVCFYFLLCLPAPFASFLFFIYFSFIFLDYFLFYFIFVYFHTVVDFSSRLFSRTGLTTTYITGYG